MAIKKTNIRTNLCGNYYSTYDFVESNKLGKEANKCFGKNWVAEDDMNQINDLIKSIGGGYNVKIAESRTQWENFRHKYELSKPTNDSNYDIFVIAKKSKK